MVSNKLRNLVWILGFGGVIVASLVLLARSWPPPLVSRGAASPLPRLAAEMAAATTPESAYELSSLTVLYTHETGGRCGLYTFPVLPALDIPALQDLYAAPCLTESEGLFLSGYSPLLSPDGRQLLIWSPYETWVANLVTGGVTKVFSDAVPASWNYQSDQIAYVEAGTLYTQTTSRVSHPTALFHEPGLLTAYARWSPDGRWIVVASAVPSDNIPQSEIWVVSASSGEAISLGIGPTGFEAAPQNIRWSRDSQSIVVGGSLLMSLDGKKQLLGAGGETAAWPDSQMSRIIGTANYSGAGAFSHDAQSLAFTQSTGDQTDISVIQIKTQQRVHLATLPGGGVHRIRWSPDDRIVFVSVGVFGHFSLWRLSIDGGVAPEVVVDNAYLVDVIPRSSDFASKR